MSLGLILNFSIISCNASLRGTSLTLDPYTPSINPFLTNGTTTAKTPSHLVLSPDDI